MSEFWSNLCFCCCGRPKEEEYNDEYEDMMEKPEVDPLQDEDPKAKIDFSEKVSYNEQYTRVREKRCCPTDIPCLILFTICVIAVIGIGIYGFLFGFPRRLYLSTDYLGRYPFSSLQRLKFRTCGSDNRNVPANYLKLPRDVDCLNAKDGKNKTAMEACEEKIVKLGLKEDLSTRKYLWFMDLTNPMTYGGGIIAFVTKNVTVCVSYCPGATPNVTDGTPVRFCPPELEQHEIIKEIPLPGDHSIELVKLTYCAFTRIDINRTLPATSDTQLISSAFRYTPIMQRCVPVFKANSSALNEKLELIKKQLSSGAELASQSWGDVLRSWQVLVLSAVLALALSFLYLVIIRAFTGVVVWGTLFFVFIAIMGLGTLTTYAGYTERRELAAQELSTTFADTFFYGGCIILGIGGLYAFLVVFLFTRIRKAIGIITEASKALATMPHMIFFPVFVFLIMAGFITYWVAASIFLWATGKPTINDFAVRFELDMTGQILFYIYILGFFWINNFFIAFIQTVVAGAVGQWYWSRKKYVFQPLVIFKSIKRALLYHIGSMAFGAFIVAIVQFLRLLFEKAYKELEKAMAENRIVKGFGWAVRIFLWLFEHIVKFINKHAYIQIALYGTNFITSAKNAFFLITRNSILVGVLHSISTIVLLLGKVAIAAATCAFGYGLVKTNYLITDGEPIRIPFIIGFITFFVGFLVASLFLSIMDTAVDTVLQCYVLNYEMSDGDKTKWFATGSMKRLIEREKKAEEESKFGLTCCCCLTCSCCLNTNYNENVNKPLEDIPI